MAFEHIFTTDGSLSGHIVRGSGQTTPPMSGDIYVLQHDLIPFVDADEDYPLQCEKWCEARDWLFTNLGNSYAIHANTIIFQSMEDATLFRLKFGGTIMEKTLADQDGEESL